MAFFGDFSDALRASTIKKGLRFVKSHASLTDSNLPRRVDGHNTVGIYGSNPY